MRGATEISSASCCPFAISIHTPHAGSDFLPQHLPDTNHAISIHTPHAGSDDFFTSSMFSSCNFNPHSPCGERLLSAKTNASFFSFQSTLPMRGATSSHTQWSFIFRYFNPHSPCGERRILIVVLNVRHDFNPHSPCGERPHNSSSTSLTIHFNPHSPCGERLGTIGAVDAGTAISIHTPHAGSDSKSYRIHIKFKNKIYDIRNKNKL